MDALTATELADLRAAIASTLIESCQIERDTVSSDGMGGQQTVTVVVADTSCRIAPAGSGTEREIAARLAIVSPWTVTLAANTDVATGDRLVIGSRRLRVAAVLAPRSEELNRRVVCAETK